MAKWVWKVVDTHLGGVYIDLGVPEIESISVKRSLLIIRKLQGAFSTASKFKQHIVEKQIKKTMSEGTFTTYMQQEVQAYWNEHKDLPPMRQITTLYGRQLLPLTVDDYADFQNGAAIIRRLYKEGAASVLCDSKLLDLAEAHASSMVNAAIRAEDWHAARAWLRPGISHQGLTYDHCEAVHPNELGATARKGRADALRDNLWCISQTLLQPQEEEPADFALSPSLSHRLVLRQAAFELRELSKYYPLQHTDLSDNLFGDGTVLDVWMECIHPHLILLLPPLPSKSVVFMQQYETELRSRSPMRSEYQRVIAEGLHSRLGAASALRLLPGDLARIIAHM